MTQTWVFVVKKSPCDQDTLCKATGLQTSTRAKGKQLGFGMGRRVSSCCGAEAVGGDGGGVEEKLMVRSWLHRPQLGLICVSLDWVSSTSAIKSLMGTTEAEGSDWFTGSLQRKWRGSQAFPGSPAALAGVWPCGRDSTVAGSSDWQLTMLMICLVKRNDLPYLRALPPKIVNLKVTK